MNHWLQKKISQKKKKLKTNLIWNFTCTQENISYKGRTCFYDKKNREQTEEAILEMLRVLVTKSKADIEAEREEREKTEETLISLLEDTCSKLTQQEQGII